MVLEVVWEDEDSVLAGEAVVPETASPPPQELSPRASAKTAADLNTFDIIGHFPDSGAATSTQLLPKGSLCCLCCTSCPTGTEYRRPEYHISPVWLQTITGSSTDRGH